MTNTDKKNILLIQPKNEGRRDRYPPLSIISLASLTPENEFDIETIDEQYEKIDFRKKYDLVGISVTTITSTRAYQIADRFRQQGVKVILGGIHATFMPQEAQQHADSIVLNEAEEIWPKILQDLRLGELKGTYQGSLIDMKNFPLLKKKFFKKGIYLLPTTQVSRGCPNSCEYCSVRAYNGNNLRTRPIEDVIEDIKNIKKNERLNRWIGFVDDNLFADREYAIKLFKLMAPLKIYWGTLGTIMVAFDEELLDHAYKSGCRFLAVGFESINPESLRSVNKFNLISRYEEGIRILKKKGIAVSGLFMFGLDGDQGDTVEKSVDFAIRNNLDDAVFQVLRPLPGTRLFERFKQEERITTFDWSKYEGCVITPKNFSSEKLMKDIEQAHKRFYSIACILKRMKGLKNYRIKRIILYFILNGRAWIKTKKGIPN